VPWSCSYSCSWWEESCLWLVLLGREVLLAILYYFFSDVFSITLLGFLFWFYNFFYWLYLDFYAWVMLFAALLGDALVMVFGLAMIFSVTLGLVSFCWTLFVLLAFSLSLLSFLLLLKLLVGLLLELSILFECTLSFLERECYLRLYYFSKLCFLLNEPAWILLPLLSFSLIFFVISYSNFFKYSSFSFSNCSLLFLFSSCLFDFIIYFYFLCERTFIRFVYKSSLLCSHLHGLKSSCLWWLITCA